MIKVSEPLTISNREINKGWYDLAEQLISPHFDERENYSAQQIKLLVIHNISLPAKQFGGEHITNLFLGKLDPNAHPSFEEIYQLKVSAHCLIRRDGNVVQYVPFDKRAWHAGVSSYCGETKCNDFSIGIELEGADDIPYTDQQYQALSKLTKQLIINYPNIKDNIVGHSDIAPGRKTDPGSAFDWPRYQTLINS